MTTNNSMNIKNYIVIVSLTLWGHVGYTQSVSCAQTLRLAQATYEEGKLHQVPHLLESCLITGFTTQEKVSAYKLLTLTYLYLEEPALADKAILLLLQTDPYFEVNQTVDPAEFIALYNSFRTRPIFRIGIVLGANASQPNVQHFSPTAIQSSTHFKHDYGFQFGINLDIPITSNLTLNTPIILQQKSFLIDQKIERGNDINQVPQFNTTTGKENQSWLTFPISIQYLIKASRLNPYVAIGISPEYALNRKLTIETIQSNAGAVQEKTYELQRNNFNASAHVSAGLKMRIFGGYVTGEIRYQHGLLNVNELASTFVDNDLIFDNSWSDPTLKMNTLVVSAGYIQNIFHPKKLKRRK
jgi:hypothetical protein